jgi:hypothetical protein
MVDRVLDNCKLKFRLSSGYITTSIELAAEWPIFGLLAARSLFTLIPYYQHVGSSLLNEQ